MSGTDFLYPFIEAGEQDARPPSSTTWPHRLGRRPRRARRFATATLAHYEGELDTVARAMAARFATGGRLFTFGNGGSATDAALVASLFSTPPARRALPARSLAADTAVITALGNDVGFELVFSRQLIAHARPGDIVFGLSTSGNSDNVVHAFAEARRRDLYVVGMAGYDGGKMAASEDTDCCFVVRSESVHRIQETQSALVHTLWVRVQDAIDGLEAP